VSKMKRALWFKDKFILDDNTVWRVADVRWDRLPEAPGRIHYAWRGVAPLRLYLILQSMAPDKTELWHPYEDGKRKKNYVVVACRASNGLGNGESD